MERKIAVITGATGGIGSIVCKHLLSKGYIVYAACRNSAKGDNLLNSITDKTLRDNIIFVSVNLESSESVDEFCNKIISYLNNEKIDILLNNAGMIASMYSITEDGYESSMQVNYLSAKQITERLLPYITGKIINTVSPTITSGEYKEPVKSDKIYKEKQSTLASLRHYSSSKRMLAHYTVQLHNRVGENIGVYGADPGVVNTSIISMHRWYDPIADILFRPFIKTPEQGAKPIINAIEYNRNANGAENKHPLIFIRNKTKKFPKSIIK